MRFVQKLYTTLISSARARAHTHTHRILFLVLWCLLVLWCFGISCCKITVPNKLQSSYVFQFCFFYALIDDRPHCMFTLLSHRPIGRTTYTISPTIDFIVQCRFRQSILCHPLKMIPPLSSVILFMFFTLSSVLTVSYTHLDVYKRQR